MIGIQIEEFRIAFREPVRSAHGILSERRGVLLTVRDRAFKGTGEASPLPCFSNETVEDVRNALEANGSALCEFARCDEAVHSVLQKIGVLLKGTPSARFAAESAFLSLRAMREGRSVAALLSKDARNVVPVNEVISMNEWKKWRSHVARALEAGVSTFKVKLGIDLDANYRMLESLRSALPAAAAVRGDANGCWSEEQALEHLHALAEFDIQYVEQPVSPQNPAALARVRAASSVPVAADESARSLETVEALLATEAADVYILKPTVLGGFLPTLAAVEAIRKRRKQAVLTTAFEGAVGRRMCFELASALPGTLLPCGLDTSRFLDEPSGADGLGLRCGALYRKEAAHVLAAR